MKGAGKSVTRWMTAASSLVQAGAEPVPAHNTGHCTRPARRPRIIVDISKPWLKNSSRWWYSGMINKRGKPPCSCVAASPAHDGRCGAVPAVTAARPGIELSARARLRPSSAVFERKTSAGSPPRRRVTASQLWAARLNVPAPSTRPRHNTGTEFHRVKPKIILSIIIFLYLSSTDLDI